MCPLKLFFDGTEGKTANEKFGNKCCEHNNWNNTYQRHTGDLPEFESLGRQSPCNGYGYGDSLVEPKDENEDEFIPGKDEG